MFVEACFLVDVHNRKLYAQADQLNRAIMREKKLLKAYLFALFCIFDGY
jgi:hypothetical protein